MVTRAPLSSGSPASPNRSGVMALRGVDLAIDRGECVGLVGTTARANPR